MHLRDDIDSHRFLLLISLLRGIILTGVIRVTKTTSIVLQKLAAGLRIFVSTRVGDRKYSAFFEESCLQTNKAFS